MPDKNVKHDCLECKHCIIEDLYNEPVCRKDNKWKPLPMDEEGFPVETECEFFEQED